MMKTTLLQLGILAVALDVSATAQTYTTIMSGEDSTQLTFPSSPASGQHATVTSVQSPFSFPSSYTFQNDYYYTYPSGSGSTPPWWFSYYACSSPGPYCTHDLTNGAISRPPTNGQISDVKSNVMGLLAEATFTGTVSRSALTSPADLLETFYFTERDDYAGQREIGVVRDQGINPYYDDGDGCNANACYDITYAYWYTNDNCEITENIGYPYCRTGQATEGNTETLGSPPSGTLLDATGSNFVDLTGMVTAGTTYIFQSYIYWDSGSSSYQLWVEIDDSTFTCVLFSASVDTTSGGSTLGITTSGVPTAYVTLGTVRVDPSNLFSGSTGVQLGVDYVQIKTP